MNAKRRAAAIEQIVREQVEHPTSVQAVWAIYSAATIARPTTAAEYRAQERAFYTGASAAANLVLHAISLKDADEARACLAAMYREFRRFADGV